MEFSALVEAIFMTKDSTDLKNILHQMYDKALEIARLDIMAYLDPASNPEWKPQRFRVKNDKSSTSDKLKKFK